MPDRSSRALPIALGILAAAATFPVANVASHVAWRSSHSLYTEASVLLLGWWAVSILASAILAVAFGRHVASRRTTPVLTSCILVSIPLLFYGQHVPPLDRGGQKRAMQELRRIGASVESLRSASGLYPPLSTVSEVSRLTHRELSLEDPWGFPYVVATRASGYTVTCVGTDGALESNPPEGPTTSVASDIIYADGQFMAYPEGVQK